MNCRDALEHLYAYLDRELNEETVRKIRAHLEICDHCLDRYEFEERLQKLISDRGRVDVDPEPLKERVLQRIREIDDQNRPSFFSRFRPFLAAVAAIIVVVVGV
jgi:mycothiol system anti-sigma-R factor